MKEAWSEAAKAIYSQPWFDTKSNETVWKQVGFFYYDISGRPIMTPTGISGSFWIMEFGKYKANIAAGQGGTPWMTAAEGQLGVTEIGYKGLLT